MGSLLRTAKKHKKSRRLGEPEVMAREEYGELEVDVKIEMIRSLIPLGLMHVHELLDDEVKELAGERYARKDELERGRRHGTNPGTVGLAGQRVPIRVPRVRSQEGVEIPLCSYEALNDGGEVNDLLLKRVLYGISCRNYEAAAEAIPGAIGLSSSTVSRGFVQVLFFTLNREDFSFVIHLDRQPRTSRRREAQTGSRARSGSRSERTLDAVEHSRTLMEWWPFLIFHRGGLRIKVINNNKRAQRNFGRCRNGICPAKMWWRCSWTGNHSPTQ